MLRLGIVDFDSSHSIEFTRRFNHAGVEADQYVDGARVIVDCPGTSKMSPERVALFTGQIAECGVEIVDEPEAMLGRIDAVLVLSLCGAEHLRGAKPFLEAGIPTFVDKPFACTYADAAEIVRLAEEHDTLMYHSSALRFSADVLDFQQQSRTLGGTQGVVSYGPAKRAEGNPGLFHYGVHAVAVLFAVMGLGCESVATTYTDDAEVVTGRWADGRIGTLRGNRAGSTAYGFVAFCDHGVMNVNLSTRYAYRNLCRSIVDSIQQGRPAVAHAANLEEIRFVLAALESEQKGGDVVALETIG